MNENTFLEHLKKKEYDKISEYRGAVKAAGGADSTVNFCLSILPSSVAVMGLMLIGCFISLSMGTSMGTIAALAPIAVGISEKTGFPMALCIGAVVSGAMFGDNLSMISDTTIAAVKTQGCEMKDKFKANFLIVLPAAVVSLLVFFLITRQADYTLDAELEYNLLQIVPYLVVLVGALIGFNVFLVLISGTVLSLIVGAATGTIEPLGIFSAVGEGVTADLRQEVHTYIFCGTPFTLTFTDFTLDFHILLVLLCE